MDSPGYFLGDPARNVAACHNFAIFAPNNHVFSFLFPAGRFGIGCGARAISTVIWVGRRMSGGDARAVLGWGWRARARLRCDSSRKGDGKAGWVELVDGVGL